jgi:hypothetical protein
MKQMPGYEYIEEYWLSAFAPRQPLNFELFDGDKLSNTGAQVLKDIFNKYDTQNKGQLNQAETTVRPDLDHLFGQLLMNFSCFLSRLVVGIQYSMPMLFRSKT